MNSERHSTSQLLLCRSLRDETNKGVVLFFFLNVKGIFGDVSPMPSRTRGNIRTHDKLRINYPLLLLRVLDSRRC
eukprot:TRINITY_DN4362_c0_g1_i1.p2 TRINITY_DN4362_c0_g1~~TRINITY_DN4362_c0_g1_i1.p2  ORF type:complete len:75 (-),score=0.89 TRINITY_DN4362_c0_g1_i1:81-305(-)